MIPTLLFVAFILMMLVGVPIGAALGLAGAVAIGLANADAQWTVARFHARCHNHVPFNML